MCFRVLEQFCFLRDAFNIVTHAARCFRWRSRSFRFLIVVINIRNHDYHFIKEREQKGNLLMCLCCLFIQQSHQVVQIFIDKKSHFMNDERVSWGAYVRCGFELYTRSFFVFVHSNLQLRSSALFLTSKILQKLEDFSTRRNLNQFVHVNSPSASLPCLHKHNKRLWRKDTHKKV